MIRSLWISKTGLDAQQTQMDVTANNLANVSTNGFKRSRAVFEDLLYQTLRQPGAQSSQQTQLPSGLQLGTGVRPVATERIFTQGNLQQTSNPLDRRHPGQRVLPGADARRQHGIHARRFAAGRRARAARDLERFPGSAGDHDTGQYAFHHHQPRRDHLGASARERPVRRSSARSSSRAS